jgi:hypothetical protein
MIKKAMQILTWAQIPVLIVLINTFTWYSLIYSFLPSYVESINMPYFWKITTLTLFFLGIAGSALLGSILHAPLIKNFLFYWISAGAILTASLNQVETFFPICAFIIPLLLGVSIGLGFPLILALFAENTGIEKRGMFGGLIWAMTGFFILLIAIVIDTFSAHSKILVLVLWRILGLISPIMLKNKDRPHIASSLPSSIKEKRVLLYLLPWLMFCLVNWTEAPLVEYLFGQQFYITTIFFQFLLVGVFAFLGGVFSDKFGRKRIITVGFIFLGIEYALLSLFPSLLFVWYLYIVLDSIIWGAFAAVLFMAVWGDLAENRRKETYYLVGGLPYLLSGYLSILIKPFVASIRIDVAFSLASFFLFLAVIPLMYAPETLPEKTLKERELRGYIEKAKKIKEKFT